MRSVNGVKLSLATALPLFAGGQPAAGAALPTRVQLLKWGKNETSSGPVIVDETTARVFSANQKAIGRERVAIDFEHNTVPGSPEFNRTNEPRAVAGHSNLVCIPEQGIFAEAITYTADGQRSALNYEDVSLAPFVDKTGRVIGAHSWTVTHTGAAYGLDFKEAVALAATTSLAGELKLLSSTTTPTPSMEAKTISLSATAILIGLSADADEAAVNAKLKSLNVAPATGAAALAEQLKELLKPLTAQITDLQTKLEIGEKATTDIKRAELVTLFAKDGKVPLKKGGVAYTADELKVLPIDLLEVLHANTAVTVPLSARNAAHATEQRKTYRVKVGEREIIDMGAIFDAEARASGLTLTPNVQDN